VNPPAVNNSAANADPVIVPSLEKVRELAREYTVIPLRYTFIEDCETPVSAFLKLRGDGPAFLLESAEQGRRFGRWSFIGVRPRSLIFLRDGVLSVDGEAREFDDPYRAVAAELERFKPAPLDGLPPFSGGAVGLFGYDLVRYVEPLGTANPDPVGLPDLALMVSDVIVAFDHLSHQVTVISNMLIEPGSDVDAAYNDASAVIAEIRERLSGAVPRQQHSEVPLGKFTSNMGEQGYAEAVDKVKEYVRAGDVLQVVPSQRWSGSYERDPFSIYRGLRTVNPSPYMYFLEFDDFAIAGASPEPLVKVTGRHAEYRPIAGTRPRGDSAEQDQERAADLLADEKERAEHVMLVDLGRNDLGRVCEYGSVQVDELMTVEIFSHVMHIVSSISGTLRPSVSAIELLRACLPAGTLAGAPKVRAMQIIDELESVKRGSYAGAVGYLSFNGDPIPVFTFAPSWSKMGLRTCKLVAASSQTLTPKPRPKRQRPRRGPCLKQSNWLQRSRTGHKR